MTRKKAVNNKVNILAIGDWIIDEDWVMMVERSTTSAKQMSEKHYHTTYNKDDMSTNRLCGVSLTASAIRAFFKDGKDKGLPKNFQCNVYGIGVWHPDDNDYMEQLFRKHTLPKTNPFKISRPEIDVVNETEKRLFNLAKIDDKCATTRIIRTFLGSNPEALPQPMSRYDWHIKWEPASKKRDKIEEIIDERVNEIFSKIKDVIFDVIVLADFNKGLINETFINSLIKRLGKGGEKEHSLWFYRSKQIKDPEWERTLDTHIKNKKSTLIKFYDPRLALHYAKGNPIICGSNLTVECMNIFRNNPHKEIHNKLAVLMSDNSVVAYDSHNKQSWVIRSREKLDYLTRGRSSIFLASLVVMELLNRHGTKATQNSFGDNCSIGIANGIKWCMDCKKIWQREKKDVVGVSADIVEAIEFYNKKDIFNIELYNQGDWQKMNNDWDLAEDVKKACCIEVSKDGGSKIEKQLQLWRAHTLMNKFTLLDKDRKTTVYDIYNTTRAFLDLDEKDRIRPLFSLIYAKPGSGKSFLAKCLAQEFDLNLFACNIAQMTSFSELSHFFDEVAVAQREEKKVFVFIDEADNRIRGESVFGYLLDMIWCGAYFRDGLKNELKPFPGLLAISTDIDDRKQNKEDKSNDHPKFKDLKSRINGIYRELNDLSSAENIYLFANLLEKYFGQISYVDIEVLEIVGKLKLQYGPRGLELFISKFRNVRGNEITFDNLPSKETFATLEDHFDKDNIKRYPMEMIGGNKQIIRIIQNIPQKYN